MVAARRLNPVARKDQDVLRDISAVERDARDGYIANLQQCVQGGNQRILHNTVYLVAKCPTQPQLAIVSEEIIGNIDVETCQYIISREAKASSLGANC